MESWAPRIGHFHIHNNDSSWDTHNALDNGSIPMKELLLRAEELCPNASFALELMEDRPSMLWLEEKGLI